MMCRQVGGKSPWMAVWRGLALASVAVAVMAGQSANAQKVYFSENFEGLTLGPPVNETIPQDNPVPEVWSPNGPAGWTVDNSKTPNGGMTEWRGWNFTDPLWWSQVAGDQQRSMFATEQGKVIAVADGDEWDDAPHDPGMMYTLMSTPAIPLAGVASGTQFNFESSWRAEEPQKAWLQASFDGGAPVDLFQWDSVPDSPNYHPDGNPELVSVPVTIPNGAQSVKFTFGYEGGNNWWWAVDNIEYGKYFEDFESVTLDTNVMEGRALGLGFDPDHVYTHTPPTGWKISNDLPGIDDDAVGVEEWEGWSFADKKFWALVAGDQNRSFFQKGEGVVAVADPDEWDDRGNPKTQGFYNTVMSTNNFDISGATADSLELTFDSSWRDECCDDVDNTNDQTANIMVSYDGKPPVDILLWSSDETNPNFKNDAENETVTVKMNNPAGAKTAQLVFGLLNSANDWWWAIDNVKVLGAGAVTKAGDFDGNGVLDAADIDNLVVQSASGANNVAYDLNSDKKVDETDVNIWVKDLKKTYVGDSNLDMEFNSSDLVSVFQAGKYETGLDANYSQGDWTGDLKFNSGDLVAAFQDGGFEKGPRAAVSAVPEPSSLVLLLAALPLLRFRRSR